MKKTILFIFLLVSVLSFAQTKGITYQAVIYNPKMGQLPGQNDKLSPLANAAICMSFEIDDLNSSTPVYRETIKTTTDAYGMINLIIGGGTKSGGSAASFEAIKWNQNIGDLIVSVDLSGTCTKFVQISKQPFTAVPFSLAAASNTGSEAVVNKSNDISSDGNSEIKYPSVKAVKEYVDNSMFLAIADATPSLKGLIQLKGDLAGTAATPTVPGLALKANTASPTFTGTVTGIDKTMVGLSNVNNTSDADKPVSTAVQTSIATKVTAVTGMGLSAESYTAAEKTKLSLISGTNTGDQDLSALATKTNLALKANTASPTFTGTVTGIDKTMVGLANVNNTSDADKPVSTAVQTSIATKVTAVTGMGLSAESYTAAEKMKVSLINGTNTGDQDLSSYATNTNLNLKEATANKSIDVATDAASDMKYPSVKSVKTYVDSQVAAATIADANSTTKGKIQLAGDLAGTAATPTVPGLALKANTASPTFTGTVTGIDKTMVGLSNVNNTSDADKPVSTAVQTSIATKVTAVTGMGLSAESYTAAEKTKVSLINGTNTGDQDLSSYATNTNLNLKEATANKSIDVATDAASDMKYPSVKSVKTYVDSQVAAATIVDANSTTKGKIQLAGDLAGTAATPTVPGLALKANTASPTFTGTVTGIDKTMVGLANVNNTSDADKPVSTAVQTSIATKVTSVTGMGLSAESYTAAEKTKVSLINGTNTGDQDLSSYATNTNLNLKEATANKSIDVATDAASDMKYPSVKSVKTYVDSQVAAATIVDANSTTKGKIQLAGDLAGTAATPTVPGLALKANTASPTFTGTVTGIDKTMVGLSNVNNTSDADKPVSTAVQMSIATKVTAVTGMGLSAESYTAAEKTKVSLINGTNTGDQDLSSYATNTNLNLKEATANKSIDVATDAASDMKYPSVKSVKTYVDSQVAAATIVDANSTTKGKIQLAGDLAGTAATPTVPGLALKANTASPTFTGTVTGIDKAMVGLPNVNNTSDADKPVSTAVQTSIATKVTSVTGMGLSAESYTAAEKTKVSLINGTNTGDQDLSSYATNTNLNLKEATANKSIDVATDAASDVKYPSVKSVKTYVDSQVAAATIVDANSTTKGKIQLAGDLAGTAATPVIATGAINSTKILDGTIADSDLNKSNIPLSGFGAATASVALGAQKITGLLDPTLAQDAATKGYVDANGATASNGLTKTTGNIALGGTLTAATTIAQGANDLTFTTTGTASTIVGGNLKAQGAVFANVIITNSENYIVTATDYNIISTNSNGSAFTMPTPSTNIGRLISIFNQGGASPVTMSDINGAATTRTVAAGFGLTFFCDGISWSPTAQ